MNYACTLQSIVIQWSKQAVLQLEKQQPNQIALLKIDIEDNNVGDEAVNYISQFLMKKMFLKNFMTGNGFSVEGIL